MRTVWARTSFASNLINPPVGSGSTQLPFTIAGLTQQGIAHMDDNLNNQDAVGILLEDYAIAGIVCDGCSGTHNSMGRTTSNNEIGAKLLTYLAIKALKGIIVANESHSSEAIIDALSKNLINATEAILKCCCDNEDERENFIADFFTATIVGFIITQEQYLVFHAGDGVVVLNNEIHNLEDSSGSYLAASILAKQDNGAFKILAAGNTNDLTNIFLATDGFIDFINAHKEAFMDFIHVPTSHKHKGLDRSFIRDFRKRLVWNKQIRESIGSTDMIASAYHSSTVQPNNTVSSEYLPKNWFNDDASCIFLKRIGEINA